MKKCDKLVGRFVVVNESRAPFVESVDDAMAELTKVIEEIKDIRIWKVEEGSMCTDVDEILMKYKTKRLVYHSGQINGVGIQLLMDNTKEIMDEVKALVLRNMGTECTKTKKEIIEFCLDVFSDYVGWKCHHW